VNQYRIKKDLGLQKNTRVAPGSQQKQELLLPCLQIKRAQKLQERHNKSSKPHPWTQHAGMQNKFKTKTATTIGTEIKRITINSYINQLNKALSAR
jgi:hypothetical protein